MKYILASLILVIMSVTTVSALADGDNNVLEVASDHSHTEKMHMKKDGKKSKVCKKRMESIDTNNDGKIDLNEYLANAKARFHKQDIDGDGYVTIEEKVELSKRMREHFGKKINKHRRTVVDKPEN